MNFKKLFLPQFLERPKAGTMMLIALIQLLVFIAFCQFATSEIIPKPIGVFSSVWRIVKESDFLDNFFATLGLIVKSMSIAILVSVFFVYLSLIPAFEGITHFISKLRYLTYTGLLFVFTVLIHDGHDIKISLFLFGIIPYFVTSLLSYVKEIPQKEYELCYTLKFNNWQTLFEVVIRGRLHTLLEVIRQNFAIAWMMITSVEGLSMAEGGLGTMMIKSNKYLNIADVFAVLLIILALGVLFDYLFDVFKVWLFPYTDTKRHANLLIYKVFAK